MSGGDGLIDALLEEHEQERIGIGRHEQFHVLLHQLNLQIANDDVTGLTAPL